MTGVPSVPPCDAGMYTFLLLLKTRVEDSEFTRASTTPVSGTYKQGHIILNDNPVPGGKLGWVCTKPGSPGQWKAWGAIDV